MGDAVGETRDEIGCVADKRREWMRLDQIRLDEIRLDEIRLDEIRLDEIRCETRLDVDWIG